MLARYKVILSYDGTNFSGFQRLNAQPEKSFRTVQGVFENALSGLGWLGKSLWAAGRTDAGVHAEGQVVAFDMAWKHSVTSLVRALNASLPQDVAVIHIDRVSALFHPRYDARWREYHYRIICQDGRAPLLERYAWRVQPLLFRERMVSASKLFMGTHDFGAFGSPPKAGGSTVRTVFWTNWHKDENVLIWTVIANAFLLHMVRRMIGLLVAIGQRRLDVEGVKDLLEIIRPDEHRDLGINSFYGLIPRLCCVPKFKLIAPPHGLHLIEVGYQPYPMLGG